MITVNANSQNQSQQPMRISSPNNVQRPIQPLQQPIHQPIQPFRQGFQPPVVMNKPIHNPVYRGPIRQPNPQMIDPYYYQRANPHHYKQ